MPASPSKSVFVKFRNENTYLSMINQLPASKSRDLATVQCCLLNAQLLLIEANILAQNLKKSNPNLDEFASNVADSLHYCTEALNQIEGINEALLPNMQQAHNTSASL